MSETRAAISVEFFKIKKRKKIVSNMGANIRRVLLKEFYTTKKKRKEKNLEDFGKLVLN